MTRAELLAEANTGDYIITGVHGEQYLFETTYELVEE